MRGSLPPGGETAHFTRLQPQGKMRQRREILNLLHCRKNIKKKKKEYRPEEERKSSSWKQIEIEGCFFLSVAWENRSLPVLREKQFTRVDCFFREREARASKTGQRGERHFFI